MTVLFKMEYLSKFSEVSSGYAFIEKLFSETYFHV